MSLKINLGAGGNILPGWENHDLDVDITKPLPWADNSVDCILAEHVFEHINSHEAMRFLDECHRILKPCGILRLCVPVLNRLPNDHARDIIFGHGHQASYTPDLLTVLLKIARFGSATQTGRRDLDGHHRQIGIAKDELETCRIEAMK